MVFLNSFFLDSEAQIVEKPSDPPKKKPTTTTTTDRYSSSLPFLCDVVYAIISGYNTVFFFGRKKSSSTEPKAKKVKTDKKSKDPNAPKRPQTAFFLFMYTISHPLSCTFGLSFCVC